LFFIPLYTAVISAFVFYLFLPVLGAFIVRNKWRKFRSKVFAAAQLDELEEPIPGRQFRITGEVDALEGEHILWIRLKTCLCTINLENISVYTLTETGTDSYIENKKWKTVQSINPGARVFITGEVTINKSLVQIKHEAQPLVILHDEEDADITKKLLLAGRSKNEYMNPITLVSFACGIAVFSFLVSGIFSGRTPPLINAMILTVAFSPILPFLPPGFAAFYIYRILWRKAREFRTSRDLKRLEGQRGKRPDHLSLFTTALSILAFAISIVLNGWIAINLLRRLL
jgi:hypothetical protein